MEPKLTDRKVPSHSTFSWYDLLYSSQWIDENKIKCITIYATVIRESKLILFGSPTCNFFPFFLVGPGWGYGEAKQKCSNWSRNSVLSVSVRCPYLKTKNEINKRNSQLSLGFAISTDLRFSGRRRANNSGLPTTIEFQLSSSSVS